MLSCRELVTETTSLSLEELQQRQRWPVRFHLMMCRHCRRYVRQLKALLGLLPHLRRMADEQTVEHVWRRIQVTDPHDPQGPAA